MLDRFERFSLAISEISRNWHKIASEEMEKYGLKGSHSVYLVTLSRCPEGMTAPQLCEICGKDKSDVSRMMAIMEQKGLVTKEGIHQKRYGGTFFLTEAGRQAAAFVRRRARVAVEIAGRELTPEKREIFYDALEQIAENLREMGQNGLPAADVKEKNTCV